MKIYWNILFRGKYNPGRMCIALHIQIRKLDLKQRGETICEELSYSLCFKTYLHRKLTDSFNSVNMIIHCGPRYTIGPISFPNMHFTRSRVCN